MALYSLAMLASAAALLAPPTRQPHSTQLQAVWSNANAIKDYHNMLSGVVNERLDDGPGVVLGLKGDAFADAYAKLAPGRRICGSILGMRRRRRSRALMKKGI